MSASSEAAGMSVSGLLENIARQHLEIYSEDFERWRKL